MLPRPRAATSVATRHLKRPSRKPWSVTSLCAWAISPCKTWHSAHNARPKYKKRSGKFNIILVRTLPQWWVYSQLICFGFSIRKHDCTTTASINLFCFIIYYKWLLITVIRRRFITFEGVFTLTTSASVDILTAGGQQMAKWRTSSADLILLLPTRSTLTVSSFLMCLDEISSTYVCQYINIGYMGENARDIMHLWMFLWFASPKRKIEIAKRFPLRYFLALGIKMRD